MIYLLWDILAAALTGALVLGLRWAVRNPRRVGRAWARLEHWIVERERRRQALDDALSAVDLELDRNYRQDGTRRPRRGEDAS